MRGKKEKKKKKINVRHKINISLSSSLSTYSFYLYSPISCSTYLWWWLSEIEVSKWRGGARIFNQGRRVGVEVMVRCILLLGPFRNRIAR